MTFLICKHIIFQRDAEDTKFQSMMCVADMQWKGTTSEVWIAEGIQVSKALSSMVDAMLIVAPLDWFFLFLRARRPFQAKRETRNSFLINANNTVKLPLADSGRWCTEEATMLYRGNSKGACIKAEVVDETEPFAMMAGNKSSRMDRTLQTTILLGMSKLRSTVCLPTHLLPEFWGGDMDFWSRE